MQNDLFVMRLNDMRAPKIEYLTVVCMGTLEECRALIDRESVDWYSDGNWGKSFRKGGPLEWYNPVTEWREQEHFVPLPPKATDL